MAEYYLWLVSKKLNEFANISVVNANEYKLIISKRNYEE